MHPVLTTLQLGEAQIPIGSYGALLALAVLVGGSLALRSAVRLGLDAGAFVASIAAAIGSGLFGAALAFSALELLTRGSLGTFGMIFYGGAIAGGLGFALSARAHRLQLATALDACLPALPIAHAVGRLGCWFGGCCYGAAWSGPWAVAYAHAWAPAAHPPLPRHPWPLYEVAVLLGLALLFGSRAVAPPGSGRRSAQYVLAYALLRCGLEPFRGDVSRGVLWGVVSTSQLISLALALGAACWLGSARLFGTRARGAV
jgi:phosphatidylglycerol---prolipoprotein diacylglyceryl transferase